MVLDVVLILAGATVRDILPGIIQVTNMHSIEPKLNVSAEATVTFMIVEVVHAKLEIGSARHIVPLRMVDSRCRPVNSPGRLSERQQRHEKHHEDFSPSGFPTACEASKRMFPLIWFSIHISITLKIVFQDLYVLSLCPPLQPQHVPSSPPNFHSRCPPLYNILHTPHFVSGHIVPLRKDNTPPTKHQQALPRPRMIFVV